MNAQVKTKLLCLAVLAASALALVRVGESTVNAAPSSTNHALSSAFEAIPGIEAVVNTLDNNGEYVSQSEGAESLANRLDSVAADDLVGVTGVGHLSDVLGYQPTGFGKLAYAANIIGFRELFIVADLINGGDGTADWVHTVYTGTVSGNVAQLVLNFEALGSFTDDDGNRLPVEMPNALLGLPGEGSVAAAARCICLASGLTERGNSLPSTSSCRLTRCCSMCNERATGRPERERSVAFCVGTCWLGSDAGFEPVTPVALRFDREEMSVLRLS